jgi:sporulation protein YlmC with PRC-barrel domain
MSVTIQIDNKELSATLKRVQKVGGTMPKIAATAAANCVKDHFNARNLARSRRSDYWHLAALRTSPIVSGSRIGVSIDHPGVALHRFGGTVVPKHAKYLTIPVADEAKGKRVAEFSDVVFRINRRTQKGVVLRGNRVLFALTKKAVFHADTSVLPTDDQFADAIIPVMKSAMERI